MGNVTPVLMVTATPLVADVFSYMIGPDGQSYQIGNGITIQHTQGTASDYASTVVPFGGQIRLHAQTQTTADGESASLWVVGIP